eukprot:2545644-Prymnesium_polylepis.1
MVPPTLPVTVRGLLGGAHVGDEHRLADGPVDDRRDDALTKVRLGDNRARRRRRRHVLPVGRRGDDECGSDECAALDARGTNLRGEAAGSEGDADMRRDTGVGGTHQ